MNRKLAVIGLLASLVAIFAAGAYFYRLQTLQARDAVAAAESSRLVRMHSPVLGPQGAPVTIVEFFDPACESCRAFYPLVKDLMARYPQDVRLVMRYAPFHKGSDEVVKLLQAAHRQGKYVAVLEAVLQAQPTWADHAQPNPALAFKVAEQAGLDLARAMQDVRKPDMDAMLGQEVEDLKALKVSGTPTFFVNGRSLPSFGPDQLGALVADEVAKAKKK
jgi:protein-disulfide isomerase